MCNRFEVDTDAAGLAMALDAQLPLPFTWEGEITNFNDEPAPGLLLNEDGRRELQPMQFSLTPAWSKERKTKYSTNNCRIEDVETKKIFAGPFRKRRCVVPLSRFREPCYWGETAGKEVHFEPMEGGLLGVAAIYEVWRGPNRGEPLNTMSMIMRPAGEYIMEHGHHRQPLFLDPEGYDAWMQPGDHDFKNLKRVLKQFAVDPPLKWEMVREMTTWKKQEKKKLRLRDEQLEAVDETGPLGY